MSFFTLVPNYGSNIVRINNPFQLQPQHTLQTRIILLSTALRTSILNYQKLLVVPDSSQNVKKIQNSQTSVNITKKERIDVEFKEQDKQTQLSPVLQKSIIEQKNTSSSVTNSKLSPVLSPKIINQCSLEKLQVVIDAKKAQNIKQPKQSAKQVLKEMDQKGVPMVDLNDCAYIPALGLTKEKLTHMRQKLRKRRVAEWNNSDKGRKDRRQLRMLSY